MKTPNNALTKENIVEIAGSAQALQVVPETSLGPASGTVLLGPPKIADPLTEPPRLNTSSGTSLGVLPPRLL
ncbi:UNVERIFIED_CONTAM: hypothetical protein Sradi_3288300 [Sesamum radiatum]|uniref:Uncharacterized protein n=1 Tax=Sesamum radiatum TaxID=300843 RepID=A0AAW2R1C9_SESRA